jgi:hypothetical protein
MHDAEFVRGGQAVGHLCDDVDRFQQGKCARQVFQHAALHVFHDGETVLLTVAIGFVDLVNRGDVRMADGADRARFAYEARATARFSGLRPAAS